MKILQVVHNFPPHSWAGTENYTLGLSLALRGLGVEAEVVFPRTKTGSMDVELFDMQGLPVMSMDFQRRQSPWEALRDKAAAGMIMEIARQRRADLIHVQHMLQFSGEVVYQAHQVGIPAVLTLHDFWLICHRLFLLDPQLRPCPGWSDENCLNCLKEMSDPNTLNESTLSALAEYHKARTGFHRGLMKLPAKVLAVSRYVLENFIKADFSGPDMATLPAGLIPFPLGDAPPKDDGAIDFVCLGTVTPLKGVLDAARAFSGLKGCRLRIYGMAPPGPYLESIKAACRANPETIFYEGAYDPSQRGRILAGADAVVVPSLTESYCLTAREALFAGKPVLASNTGGIPEAVRHGVNGLLFEPGDWRQLREHVQGLIKDSGLLKRLAQGVRQPHVVMDDAKAYLDIYQQALQGF